MLELFIILLWVYCEIHENSFLAGGWNIEEIY